MKKHFESSPTTSTNPDGFAIVADLLSRQDAVLTELDSLNDRIEAVILQINSLRQAEMVVELGANEAADSAAALTTLAESPIARAA